MEKNDITLKKSHWRIHFKSILTKSKRNFHDPNVVYYVNGEDIILTLAQQLKWISLLFFCLFRSTFPHNSVNCNCIIVWQCNAHIYSLIGECSKRIIDKLLQCFLPENGTNTDD